MRSLLLVRPDRETTDAALSADADCLIFDFPAGSVAGIASPADEIARAVFTEVRQKPRPALLYVRISGLHDESADSCLDNAMALHPDGIVFAARNGADIQHLSIKLAVREAELGIEDGATKILAEVPATTAAIFGLASLANASARLAGLIFAQQELERALGIAPDAASASPIATARHFTLFAAKAANVPAIDAPSPASIDAGKLRAICEASRHEGFSGKLALAGDQVAILNAAYAEP